MRNAMLSLKEADPIAWEHFLAQFLKDMGVIPPKFYQESIKAEIQEEKRRIAMSYLTLLAEDDPQSIINRLEVIAKTTQSNEVL